jgi:diaminohydroxyphosphoribosylaminopyrimidine deaminase/5-amino-6-(5-phosphoribosylamino)uracil reductase
LRAEHAAILVGGGTAQADNPALTNRWVPGPQPTRLVLWRKPQWTAGATLFENPGKVIVLSNHLDINTLPAHHPACNVQVWWPAGVDSNDFPRLFQALYATHQIGSLLVEGGAYLLQSLLNAGCWDEAFRWTTPILAPTANISAPTVPFELSATAIQKYETDTQVHYRNPSLSGWLSPV